MNSTKDPHSAGDRTSIMDSPWLWLAIFLFGAAVALVLAGPKYSWRQPQIERQYQARERSGATIAAADGPQAIAQAGKPIIGLRPLQILITMALVISGCVFWVVRLRMWRRQRN